jgi:hypothetical protein
MNDENRQAGRTTRMLEQAIEASKNGDVLVFIGENVGVRDMIFRVRALCNKRPQRLVISESYSAVKLSGGEIRFADYREHDRVRGHRFTNIFADHTVGESLFMAWFGDMRSRFQ